MALPEVASTLRACVEYFEGLPPVGSNAGLMVQYDSASIALQERLTLAAVAVDDLWDHAERDARADIIGLVAELGGVLAGVDAARFGDARQSAADCMQLAMVCITFCSSVCARGGWAGSSADLFRWARCGSLIVSGGPVAVGIWLEVARLAGASPPDRIGVARTVLELAECLAEAQLCAMRELFHLLFGSKAQHERSVAAWLASVLTPHHMLAWLAAVATAKCTVLHAADVEVKLHTFCVVSLAVLHTSDFAAHQAALSTAPQHQAALAALLLPIASEAVEEVAAYSHKLLRSNAYGTSSSNASSSNAHSSSNANSSASASSTSSSLRELRPLQHLLRFLSVPCLERGVQGQLLGRWGTVLVEAVAGLLGSLCGLVAHDAAAVAPSILANAAAAWGRMCFRFSRLTPAQWSSEAAPAQRVAVQRAVQQLGVLARMSAGLQAAEEASLAAFLAGVSECATLAAKAGAAQPAGGWAAAELLGHVSGAVQASQAVARFAAAAPDIAAGALSNCQGATDVLLRMCLSDEAAWEEVGEQQQLEAQLRAVHAATCRVVHFAAGLESFPQPARYWLLASVDVSFRTVRHVNRAIAMRATPPTATPKQACAAAAAHVSALAAGFRHWDGSVPTREGSVRLASDAAILTGGCLQMCSPWLAGGEPGEVLAAAVHVVAQALGSGPSGGPEQQDQELLKIASELASKAEFTPQVAMSLVSGGAMGGLVQGCLAAGPSLEQVTSLHYCLHQIASDLARGAQRAAQADASSPAAQLQADVLAAATQLSRHVAPLPSNLLAARAAVQDLLPLAAQLVAALEAHWHQPEQQAAAALELAQAAATRGCANLRCANLGAQGGPDWGQVAGSKRCSGCRAVRYCCTACQTADWRGGGHRKVCTALAALRVVEAEAAGSVAAQKG